MGSPHQYLYLFKENIPVRIDSVLDTMDLRFGRGQDILRTVKIRQAYRN
jgi:hypothetical protein